MRERPRIALVDHVARMGGAEVSLLNIAKHADRGAVELVAVLGEEGPLADRLRAATVDVVVQGIDRRVLDRRKDTLTAGGLAHPLVLVRTARSVVAMARLFRARRIDLVHTNSLKAHLLAGVAGRLAGKRVVWHVRDHLSSPYLPRAAVAVVRAAARAIPHRVVAVSASAAHTVGRDDVVVVHQGVELPDDAAEAPARRRLRIGLVGRIAPWKGQDVFVAAAARLTTEFPDAEFLVIGAPLFGEQDYERELRHRVGELGLDARVRFTGFRGDIWDVYRELDVVVHASTQPEPYGNVALEAMASRRALVAAGAGGILELVEDGRTGLLVPPGDADALAEALARLLRDPDERRRLADEGRRHVESSFPVSRAARELELVWRSVLRGAEVAAR